MSNMYEVVRTVNGYEIVRMIGSRTAYHVTISETANGVRAYRTFRTQKAAAAFCESLPAR